MGSLKEPAPDFVTALAALRDGLSDVGAPYAFIGGVAVIAAGVARFTVDIDATISGANINMEGVVTTLARHGIGPRMADALEFARQRQVLLLEHTATGIPLDVSVAWLPFEEEAIARCRPIDFGGEIIPVADPEDLIVYKIVAGRAQDLADVNSLLLLHGRGFRLDRIRELVREFGEALGTDLIETLDRELRKAALITRGR